MSKKQTTISIDEDLSVQFRAVHASSFSAFVESKMLEFLETTAGLKRWVRPEQVPFLCCTKCGVTNNAILVIDGCPGIITQANGQDVPCLHRVFSVALVMQGGGD